ncbi:hypothetical protein XO10_06365 [Marinitoga sp. 1135]|uniref:methyl-accepting chemotaxis protein n=1 Tax=Marinitoga sp. 1135 TaxID=1643333 RepID=UPI001586632A|nr:methyl-accepting chemotaxis protein [Marinitoga sp. 1135]NUU95900.1 hypothetical protein [Marinitoga sp. 1135]
MKIKTKMMLLLVLAVVVFTIIGSFVFLETSSLEDKWIDYIDSVTTRQKILSDIKAQFGYGGGIHIFKNYVLRGYDKYISAFEEKEKAILKDFAEYEKLHDVSQEELKNLEIIKNTFMQYSQNLQLAIKLKKEGKSISEIDKIIKIDDGPALKAFGELEKIMDKLTREKTNEFEGNIRRLQYLITAVSIALIITVLVTFMYILYMMVPLYSVRNKLEELSKSGGDLVSKLEVKTSDEIGEISKFFNHFIDSFRTSLQGFFNRFRNNITQFNTINHELKIFKTNFDDIDDALTRTKSSLDNITSYVEEQNASTLEISDNIQNLANTAVELSNIAHEISDVAESGRKSLNNVNETINNISESMVPIVDKVKAVSDKAQIINEVVETITSISEQTNLLALNAAIEAARAGEAGKGFAVVADEIRKLAEESRNAAESIRENLGEVMTGVNEASDMVIEMSENIKSVSEMNDKTSNELYELIDSVEKISNYADNLAASAQQQGAAVQELSASSQNITELVNNLKEEMDEIVEEEKYMNDRNMDLLKIVEEEANQLINTVETFSTFKMFTHKDLINELNGAKEAHRRWVKRFEESVHNNTWLAAEDNPHRCGFGVFVKVLSKNVPEEINDIWSEILKYHEQLHNYAKNFEYKNRDKNEKLLSNVKETSTKLESLIDQAINKLS